MIKNIIFDVDGVLVDCDLCYLNFLRDTYEEFKNIKYEDLPSLFPLEDDNGALKRPDKFAEDFYNSPYYCNRPLFEDTMTVLGSLKKKGINLFTLSAAKRPMKKQQWLDGIFIDIFNEIGFSPAGVPKAEALEGMLAKHSLNKHETIFVDDRFFNIKAGIEVGVHTVRMQPEHHLPLPEELSHIKYFTSLSEFEKYVDELNAKV